MIQRRRIEGGATGPDGRNSVSDYPTLALCIDGNWLSSGSAGSRPVVNPADESVLGLLPLAGDEELDLAVAAARRSFESWKATPAHARWEVITRATRLLRERADAIARVMTLEQGKPLAESRREVLLSAEIIDFLAEEGKRAYGRLVPPRTNTVFAQMVSRVPVGPAALFTPWNFPMNLPARKVGAALAAGCSAILKPAEETPGSALELVRAFHDAGLPPGVLNLVCGDPAQVSARLIASEGIRKVSFTGSIPVGKHLGELCARGVKRYTAELGGHAPVLVLGDADAAHVAQLSVTAKFRNAGQVCASPTRFLVHEALFEPFVAAFAAATRRLRIGSGLEPDTDMGPLAHARRIGVMEALVEDALARGATLACGGKRLRSPGYFFEPTVLTNVPGTARIMREEPFGPIAIINAWEELEAAISQANGLPYGLSAYLFTRDLALAHTVSARLEAGMVGVNHFGVSQPETPFGGVKESGYGSESGQE
ncbi:MAG: NAD-dependent succinate-semialdehyde dehydrogenase, partial [Rhodocyclaceae bacterium]|nr:NAD-dependent succinate-semialdehyde dehydrogenase [Rhodocyclaceae bacterium]